MRSTATKMMMPGSSHKQPHLTGNNEAIKPVQVVAALKSFSSWLMLMVDGAILCCVQTTDYLAFHKRKLDGKSSKNEVNACEHHIHINVGINILVCV